MLGLKLLPIGRWLNFSLAFKYAFIRISSLCIGEVLDLCRSAGHRTRPSRISLQARPRNIPATFKFPTLISSVKCSFNFNRGAWVVFIFDSIVRHERVSDTRMFIYGKRLRRFNG